MYILFCTQKRRYFIMARDTVNGQGSGLVHAAFDVYPKPEDLVHIEPIAQRIKPHLDDTVAELYRRVRAFSLGDVRYALSEQLYRLSRRLKIQRNELDSGFLEGFAERQRLNQLQEQHDTLERLLGLKRAGLFEACRLKELILETAGWSARFSFDDCEASELRIGFAFDADGKIWVEKPDEQAA